MKETEAAKSTSRRNWGLLRKQDATKECKDGTESSKLAGFPLHLRSL